MGKITKNNLNLDSDETRQKFVEEQLEIISVESGSSSGSTKNETLEDNLWKDSFDKLVEKRSPLGENNIFKKTVRASYNKDSSVEISADTIEKLHVSPEKPQLNSDAKLKASNKKSNIKTNFRKTKKVGETHLLNKVLKRHKEAVNKKNPVTLKEKHSITSTPNIKKPQADKLLNCVISPINKPDTKIFKSWTENDLAKWRLNYSDSQLSTGDASNHVIPKNTDKAIEFDAGFQNQVASGKLNDEEKDIFSPSTSSTDSNAGSVGTSKCIDNTVPNVRRQSLSEAFDQMMENNLQNVLKFDMTPEGYLIRPKPQIQNDVNRSKVIFSPSELLKKNLTTRQSSSIYDKLETTRPPGVIDIITGEYIDIPEKKTTANVNVNTMNTKEHSPIALDFHIRPGPRSQNMNSAFYDKLVFLKNCISISKLTDKKGNKSAGRDGEVATQSAEDRELVLRNSEINYRKSENILNSSLKIPQNTDNEVKGRKTEDLSKITNVITDKNEPLQNSSSSDLPKTRRTLCNINYNNFVPLNISSYTKKKRDNESNSKISNNLSKNRSRYTDGDKNTKLKTATKIPINITQKIKEDNNASNIVDNKNVDNLSNITERKRKNPTVLKEPKILKNLNSTQKKEKTTKVASDKKTVKSTKFKAKKIDTLKDTIKSEANKLALDIKNSVPDISNNLTPPGVNKMDSPVLYNITTRQRSNIIKNHSHETSTDRSDISTKAAPKKRVLNTTKTDASTIVLDSTVESDATATLDPPAPLQVNLPSGKWRRSLWNWRKKSNLGLDRSNHNNRRTELLQVQSVLENSTDLDSIKSREHHNTESKSNLNKKFTKNIILDDSLKLTESINPAAPKTRRSPRLSQALLLEPTDDESPTPTEGSLFNTFGKPKVDKPYLSKSNQLRSVIETKRGQTESDRFAKIEEKFNDRSDNRKEEQLQGLHKNGYADESRFKTSNYIRKYAQQHSVPICSPRQSSAFQLQSSRHRRTSVIETGVDFERFSSSSAFTGSGDYHHQNSQFIRSLLFDEEQNLLLCPSLDVSIRALLSPRDIVLRRCGQTDPYDFSVIYSEAELRYCRKIGEGVYGEVFMNKNSKGEAIVLKIIPIEGNIEVNGEQQKNFEQILPEIIIAGELSSLRNDPNYLTGGFVEVKNVHCVQGRYPDHLIDLWELYRDNCGTENDHPEIFPEEQLYIVLELANGGQDLEAFQFQNGLQSFSAFIQTALSLAVAEQKYKFEHRDLHWGNILLAPTDEKTITFKLDDRKLTIPSYGVKVTIIDYTLSRMNFEGCCLYNNLSNDNDLFTASGDYQFDIYRLMKKNNENQWERFDAFTNILWLHYAIDKMISGARYRCSKTKKHRTAIQKMMKLRDELLDYKSASDYVLFGIKY